uniref:LITAF domain-containing protein n=1 Tax=Chromera velia CCMP2878 TaxID=1169474 RepID=A0A0G4HWC8_9ALVE|eukprot:Cvel_9016.t1-p1 / transcript=Cvel_9016.t1 / gene=Cvel_9016 / organism=Chromera_velia_CCMP2878 / gene_product=Lipopolysaccharide-induced tumor necrosis, putative / transcript_product=Lipopolysaccharide-induced tumor necrosis, putative / location=Cvel_scaffold510:60820-61625(+) / protein_length=173 / sequence_SO=supercontig / SO=protein_coding / is_pseudo=false
MSDKKEEVQRQQPEAEDMLGMSTAESTAPVSRDYPNVNPPPPQPQYGGSQYHGDAKPPPSPTKHQSQFPPPPQPTAYGQAQSSAAGAGAPVAVQQEIHLVHLDDQPMHMICPQCKQRMVTNVTYEAGNTTWLACCLLGVFCFPFCCIPFCCDKCKDCTHYCSACNVRIGTHKS